VINIQNDIVSLKKEDRPETQFFCRVSRYVNERIRRVRNYRTFLVSLRPVAPLLKLYSGEESSSFFAKFHIPQTHTLNRTNFSLTIEDLTFRLNKMKLRFPLCVMSSGNNPAARLNFQQAMGGSIDGKDYIMFVFVPKNEIQSYKRRWPNQILVELPFSNDEVNWRDLARQTIKVFGETLGTEYVFMVDDNLYCAYKSNENKFEPVPLMEYFEALQSCTESGSPLIGSRVVGLGPIDVEVKENEWENGFVQSAFLVKTQDFDVYFEKSNQSEFDDGLDQFNRACNNVATVQQNQFYVLQCGYTIDDPAGNDYRDPDYTQINTLEPDQFYGYNLAVRVLSNETAIDTNLSDGTRFARGFVVVADETASILLIAKNEQIEQLEVGKNYYIRNCYISMYKGYMRVELDEWGKIQEFSGDINVKPKPKCMSTIEYELVGGDEDDGSNEEGGNDEK